MTQPTPDPAEIPRRSDMLYPAMVIALLTLSVGIGTSVFVAAHYVDDGPQVEADYYTRALNWEEHRRQVERAMALGWQVDVRPGPERIHVQVRDRHGEPVVTDGGRIVVRRSSRSAPLVDAELTRIGPGEYAVNAGLAQRGLWDFFIELNATPDQVASFQLRRELR